MDEVMRFEGLGLGQRDEGLMVTDEGRMVSGEW